MDWRTQPSESPEGTWFHYAFRESIFSNQFQYRRLTNTTDFYYQASAHQGRVGLTVLHQLRLE